MTWLCIRTITRQEKRAAQGLTQLGPDVAVYLPCSTAWRRHANRKERVQRPLFPGYLFVSLPDSLQHAALGVDGVQDFIRSRAGEPRPLSVDPQAVEGLRALEQAGGFDDTRRSKEAEIFPGAKVRIAAGPFSGFIATVQKARGNRVKVLYEMFGRSGAMTVDAGKLRAA